MNAEDPLIAFVSSVSGEQHLKVEENLGDGYVRLRISEAERRQAKHDIRGVEDLVVELMRNSRDAHAQRLFIATAREGDTRTMTVIDDGVGIPAHMHEAVFEPRVTSKLETMVVDRWGVHGRGMALFSVKENVSTARIAASGPHKGTSVVVACDTSELPERSDQSTWPEVEVDETGALKVRRGPHNMLRRMAEFACEHPEVELYVGSPAEIASTLHDLARLSLETRDLLFCEDMERFPVWQRIAACSEAAEVVEIASSIGVPVSERTAHRIIGGELKPAPRVLDLLAGTVPEEPPAETAPDIYKDRRGLKLHGDDVDAFKRGLEEAFEALAERYYIQLKGDPKVKISKDEIRVRFQFEKDE